MDKSTSRRQFCNKVRVTRVNFRLLQAREEDFCKDFAKATWRDGETSRNNRAAVRCKDMNCHGRACVQLLSLLAAELEPTSL
jgi:hypothetical protein